jgi:hypothetical protein
MPQCDRIKNVSAGGTVKVLFRCASIFDNPISRDELCEFWWTNARSGFNPKGKKL